MTRWEKHPDPEYRIDRTIDARFPVWELAGSQQTSLLQQIPVQNGDQDRKSHFGTLLLQLSAAEELKAKPKTSRAQVQTWRTFGGAVRS